MQSSLLFPHIQDESKANLFHLGLAWIAFLLSFCVLAHIRFGLIAIPFISLAFQQYLAGVIHEAAHWNMYRPDKRINERVGNWGASFVFGYSLSAYRKEHFRHHASDIFLNEADGETAEYKASGRAELIRGFLRDLLFVTSAKMVVFRLKPMFSRPAKTDEGTGELENSFKQILLFNACLWGALALAASLWAVVLFWLSFLMLYPLSNRIRVYATHGDVSRETGTADSDVAVNVLSPVYERIFFGNRMMMYHHEHHLRPNLPFRKLEQLAWERYGDTESRQNYRVNIPSYFFALTATLFPPRAKYH